MARTDQVGKPDDRVRRLAEAERRIVDHPAHKAYLECLALERTITAVFIANHGELVAMLDEAAKNERLAIELIQNTHKPDVRDAFHARVTQRLHNYLAATGTLADHARRIMRGRTGRVADEYTQRKTTALEHPEIPFMQQLRDYTLHRVLPFFRHTLTFTDINTPTQAMASEVELSVSELLEWNNWSQVSRVFLARYGATLPLREVVRRHGALVVDLNVWLHTMLVTEGAVGLDELNELVVARNAELSGQDFETARRLTDEWTARRAQPAEGGT